MSFSQGEIGEKLGPFDLAAVPIAAHKPRAMMRESHMNPEEAGRAAQDLRAEAVMGIHFETFDLSDEPLAEASRRFIDATAETDYGNAWLLNIDETRPF